MSDILSTIAAIGITAIFCIGGIGLLLLHTWLRSRELGEQDDEDD